MLGDARTPDGRLLELVAFGDELYLEVDRRNLMSSVMVDSEVALARLCLPPILGRSRPRILIGGLGMGFTLRATLDVLGPGRDAEVMVTELIPEVVTWNQDVLGDVAGRPMEDPRVAVSVGDVAAQVAGDPRPFDAILLDVDNGPHPFTDADNAGLYNRQGIERLVRGLTPGGVLGIWSAHHEPRFAERLRRTGLAVETHRIRSQHRKVARVNVVYVGVLRDETCRLDPAEP